MATELKILYLDRHTGKPLHPAWLRGLEEAAAYARLKDKRTLKKWIANGLQYVMVGREYYFKCDWIDEYMMATGQSNRHPITEQILKEG